LQVIAGFDTTRAALLLTADAILSNADALTREDMNALEMEAGSYRTSELQATAVVNDVSIKSEKIHLSGFE
jgi:hypothetical protein